MGQTNRKKFGELLDEVSQQNDQGTGFTDPLELNHSFNRETDYDTNWQPVTDEKMFKKTLRLTDRRTSGLTAPLTDARKIGRFAAILKTLDFTDPKNAVHHGTSIGKVTNQVDRFLEECEITPDTPQLEKLRFHASILETAAVPWIITEIYVKDEKEGFSNTTPAIEIGVPSTETGFIEGVRDASRTPYENELAGHVRSTVNDSGYSFYPFITHGKGSISYPGVLDSQISPGGVGDDIVGFEHKGIIKSSFPER